MEKVAKGHHSLADWDYRPGCPFGLYPDQFISPPSCLRNIENAESLTSEFFYLKASLAPCIADGRIVDWHRWTGSDVASSAYYLFRCQDCPETGLPQSCYELIFQYGTLELFKMVDGSPQWLSSYDFAPNLNQNTWYHFRVTFWQYTGTDLNKVLRITFEMEIDEEWAEMWYFDDPLNLWAESEVNRIGFGGISTMSDHFQWFDDTEIWKKIE
jgi:hypothetical protein